MYNFENAKIEVTEKGGSLEPAKAMLENTDALLKELASELDHIEFAIFGKERPMETKETCDTSMLETLNRQKNVAETCLRTAIHIREGLW